MFLPRSDILLHFALPLLIAVWSAYQVWRCARANKSWGPWAVLLVVGLGYVAGASYLAMLGAGLTGAAGVQPANQGACKVAVHRLVGANGTLHFVCSASGNSGVLRTADGAIIGPVAKGQEVIDAICWADKDFDFSGKGVELAKSMGGKALARGGCTYRFQCLIDGADVKVVSVLAGRSGGASDERCVAKDAGER